MLIDVGSLSTVCPFHRLRKRHRIVPGLGDYKDVISHQTPCENLYPTAAPIPSGFPNNIDNPHL